MFVNLGITIDNCKFVIVFRCELTKRYYKFTRTMCGICIEVVGWTEIESRKCSVCYASVKSSHQPLCKTENGSSYICPWRKWHWHSTCLNDAIQSHENPFVELQTQYSQNRLIPLILSKLIVHCIKKNISPWIHWTTLSRNSSMVTEKW